MSSTIHANAIAMNYRFDGPEDAPVVMFSNSLLSTYAMWDWQLDALTGNYRVLRYDTRGHGGTDAPEGPYSIGLLAADAHALLAELGISRLHFVGLSMGGFIGQVLAAKWPEMLISLSLCDTACEMPAKNLWDDRIKMAEENGVEALVEGTLERWFTAPFHETGQADLDKIRDMILGAGVQGYVENCKAIRDMSQRHLLAQIKTPTMVLVGEQDPACPVDAARVLHDGIAGSELVILPQSAHLPNVEQAAAFNGALLDFLGRNA